MTPASPLYNGDFKSVILQLPWKYTLSTAQAKSGFISKPFLVRDTYVYACLNTTFDFSDEEKRRLKKANVSNGCHEITEQDNRHELV